MSDYAAELLRRQYRGMSICYMPAHGYFHLADPPSALLSPLELSRNPPDGISVGLGDDDNLFKWEMMIIGPPDTAYEGGFFKAKLDFPPDFPNMPPVMRFTSTMWHPNIYKDGKVVYLYLQILCIFPTPSSIPHSSVLWNMAGITPSSHA